MTKTYDVLLTTDHGNHRKSFSKFVFAKSFLDEIKFIYNAHLYKPLEFEDYNNLSYIELWSSPDKDRFQVCLRVDNYHNKISKELISFFNS